MNTWTRNRKPITEPVPDLIVTKDGAIWVVAERPHDLGYYVARRTPIGLIACYRFGLRRAAIACRDELSREILS